MDLNFSCTACGGCCHDLKLPLGIDEAIVWLERGDTVEILCEALPWPEEPALDDLPAQHKRNRSFSASSGSLPTRVVVILAGAFDGACPNLQANMLCGIYEQRPRVCRIYPAEINPFIALAPEHKACPPEAWSNDKPSLIKGGRLVDAQTIALIEQSRAVDASDARGKAHACVELGIHVAALANEGFVVHSPPTDRLLAALRRAREGADADAEPEWSYVSNRRETFQTLASVGASSMLVPAEETVAFKYLGFFPPSL